MGEAGEVSRGQSLWVLECQAQECGPGSEGNGEPRQDLEQDREKPQETE